MGLTRTLARFTRSRFTQCTLLAACALTAISCAASNATVGSHLAATEARHPLEPLTAQEIEQAVRLLQAQPGVPDTVRFASILLHEPAKAALLNWQAGNPVQRVAKLVGFDPATNQAFETLIDLTNNAVLKADRIELGQPMLTFDDYEVMPALVQQDPRVQQALTSRGITDFENVQVDIWAPGFESVEGIAPDRRIARALFFYIGDGVIGYGRPIEGLTAVLDLNARQVVHVHDYGVTALAPKSHDYFASPAPSRRSHPLKPLRIQQKQGPSFVIEGNQVRWDNWQFRFRNDQREGLVIHQLSWNDQGRPRSILYRGSLSEMVVPYGDPHPHWAWRAAFDQGEYGMGHLSNPLVAGVDVPDNAVLLDAVFADDFGQPYIAPDSVAIYERDAGLLWKHTDDYDTGLAQARRARELVVTQTVTVGNYDYSISWVLTQDAQIKIEVALTGMLLAKGVDAAACERCAVFGEEQKIDAAADRFGTLVAPQVVAPNHQHFFSFRLDLDIDQPTNSVAESSLRRAPETGSPNAFVRDKQLLTTEQTAQRDVDTASHRRWMVLNPQSRTPLGHFASYMLVPGDNAPAYLADDAPLRQHAPFVNHHLFVTRHNEDELHAGGDYPNQGRPGQGLTQFTADNESTENADVVLWYTLNAVHPPRVEEWPVMPASIVGFRLVPDGFFTRNPALDVPE